MARTTSIAMPKCRRPMSLECNADCRRIHMRQRNVDVLPQKVKKKSVSIDQIHSPKGEKITHKKWEEKKNHSERRNTYINLMTPNASNAANGRTNGRMDGQVDEMQTERISICIYIQFILKFTWVWWTVTVSVMYTNDERMPSSEQQQHNGKSSVCRQQRRFDDRSTKKKIEIARSREWTRKMETKK